MTTEVAGPTGGAVESKGLKSGALGFAVQDIGERITSEAVEQAHAINAAVDTRVELVNDRPADALLRAADEYDALAIVFGSAGRGPIAVRVIGRDEADAQLLAKLWRFTAYKDPGPTLYFTRLPFQGSQHQVFLAFEVLVKRRLADAHIGQNLVDPDVAKAVAVKPPDGRLDQPLTCCCSHKT